MKADAPSFENASGERFAAVKSSNAEPLRDCVRDALSAYFHKMGGHEIHGLYELIMAEIEEPLLRSVMEYTRGNQTRAASVLGISRSTLRKKLARYNLN